MFELRSEDGKGRSLFSTRNIKAGERILDEVGLFESLNCCSLSFLSLVNITLFTEYNNRKRTALSSLNHFKNSAAHIARN